MSAIDNILAFPADRPSRLRLHVWPDGFTGNITRFPVQRAVLRTPEPTPSAPLLSAAEATERWTAEGGPVPPAPHGPLAETVAKLVQEISRERILIHPRQELPNAPAAMSAITTSTILSAGVPVFPTVPRNLPRLSNLEALRSLESPALFLQFFFCSACCRAVARRVCYIACRVCSV